MTYRFFPSTAVAAAIVMFSLSGAVQAQSDAERCGSPAGNSDQRTQACTRAIDSGKFSGESLATLHFQRGSEWNERGAYDRAITDYDAALRLNPKLARAYYARGNAWAGKGESDKAIADYDAAIRLNPKDTAPLIGRAVELTVKGEYARAIADYDAAIAIEDKVSMSWLGRGRTRFYAGDYARSAADLERSLEINRNAYTLLWLYLARKHGGAPDAEESLDAETRVERASGWPGPLITLFVGRTDLDSVRAAATDRDPIRQAGQRCEADFYVAHWYLLRNERDRALPLLKQALSGCSTEYIEHEGAVAELRRLTK
jgi:tetratricopeptide (TPR) repeat protein